MGFLLLLVLLLAAVLRIYHITQQSLWFDEAFAWNIIKQHDMYPRIAADTHPPLYYVLLRGWVTVAGDSALSLRYLSAMFSLMTVAVVYQIARELVRGSQQLIAVPVMAALVIALSDAEIFLAQESRNYTLYTLTACLSMWFYLRWLGGVDAKTRYGRDMSRPYALLQTLFQPTAIAWVLATAALIYTHYHGLFIPAIQGLHALLFLRGRKRLQAIGLLIVSGLIFLPWFAGVTLPQAQHAIDNSLPYAIPSNWETFLHLRDNYLGAQWALMLGLAIVGLWVLLGNKWISEQGSVMRTPSPNPFLEIREGEPAQQRFSSPVYGGGGDALPHMATHRRRGLEAVSSWPNLSAVFIAFMWFALPFSVLYFGNLYSALLTERKLLIVVPAISLLIGTGLGWLRNPARSLLALAILIYGVSTVDYYRLKEPWREVAADPLPYVQPTDLAMVEVGVGQYAMKYYWDHLLPESVYLTTFPFPQIRDWTLAPTTDVYTYYDGLLPQLLEETKDNRIGQVATVWFAYWDKEQVNFQRLEEAGYVRTMSFSHAHLDDTIYLYRYDNLPQSAIVDFENGMILRAVEFDPQTLRADLWWQTDLPLTADYTTSVKIFNAEGQVVAQKDSQPGQSPTSAWTATDTWYDGKFLELVDGLDQLPPGDYTVTAEIYQWTPDALLPVLTAYGDEAVEIGETIR